MLTDIITAEPPDALFIMTLFLIERWLTATRNTPYSSLSHIMHAHARLHTHNTHKQTDERKPFA